MLTSTGIPSEADVLAAAPSEARRAKGAVACIECFQQIPCNPCTAACVRKAIQMEGSINALPKVDFDKCNGCGRCVSFCPGLAIFIVDETFAEDMALVKLPFEYYPVPQAGQYATGLDRAGQPVGRFRVNKVTTGGAKNMTYTISLEVPKALSMVVRNIEEGGYSHEPA